MSIVDIINRISSRAENAERTTRVAEQGSEGCLAPAAGQAELAWLAIVGTWDRANKEIRTHSVTLVGKARFKTRNKTMKNLTK